MLGTGTLGYFLRIAFVLIISFCSVLVSSQTYQERVYDLPPEYDTFIRGLGQYHRRLEYIEIGNIFEFAKSRILLKFNTTKFMTETSWNAIQESGLPMSTIERVTLKLFCVNVITSHSQNRYDDVFNDTVNVAKILVPWDVANVTNLWRSGEEYWHTPYLATTGEDATAPIARSQLVIDYRGCEQSEDATVAFPLKDVFLEWLDNPGDNHGLLLWAESDDSDIGVVKFGSKEYAIIGKHPRLEILLKDYIDETGTCPPGQFHCIEGTCISDDKVCDFNTDCLHASDEELCGVECSFEGSTCNWEIVHTENRWHHVNASSVTIGPSKDQSEDSRQGHFIVHSTSDWQNSSSTALLQSPNYTESGPQCILSLHYQLSGEAADSLTVYVRIETQKVVAWSVKGRRDQEEGWQEAYVHIGRLREPFQIEIEGILDPKNGGQPSYIAVDSIRFQFCSPELSVSYCFNGIMCKNEVCIDKEELCDFNKDCLFGEDEDHDACDSLPEGARCNFEDENTCGWFNDQSTDYFDWTRHSGHTPTSDTGPSGDHTLGTDQGHYMYIEVSRLPDWKNAIFRSPLFPPPPADNWEIGEHYESCKLQFFYHMYGASLGYLRVYTIQNDTYETASQLWTSPYSADDDEWIKETVPLTENIQDWYYIEFEGTRGHSYHGDIAIDDVSLSPECFDVWPSRVTSSPPPIKLSTPSHISGNHTKSTISTTTTDGISVTEKQTVPPTNATQFTFTPCSALGMDGPSQAQCNSAYKFSSVYVRVLEEEPYKGIQVWTVPMSSFYSITAKGGGGGTGVENPGPSQGAKVEAVFYLEAGEDIYILVGQEGLSACETTSFISKSYCDGIVSNEERWNIGPDGNSAGGGGGGGGGTFVFKRNVTTDEKIPLLIAGGGGGLAFSRAPSLADVGGRIDDPGDGGDGFTAPQGDVSGGGGGWTGNVTTTYAHAGKSVSDGGQGGEACQLAFREFRWETLGGFGGGGGACSSGGGGGGYSGGDATLSKSLNINGKGGTSYVHESAQHVNRVSGENAGDGQVVITAVPECMPDEYLSLDRTTCVKVEGETSTGTEMPINMLVVVVVIAVAMVLVIIALSIFCVKKKRKQKKFELTYDLTDYQLEQLRQTAVMDFNPNYVLSDGMSKLQELNEVPRGNLQLLSALGHGAFGEVYRGTFQVPDKNTELQVAVKTLPELSTQQDELDFIMEALILTKFHHPNIVECLGVCFTQTPRFIILELMQGGELRDFLRENRPTKDKVTVLKMVDLLNIAMDIAKGCEYLEAEKFIHRDIAARNILLSGKGADIRTAKIGDFGMARNIYRNEYYRKGGKAMLPVKWMPPEAYLDGIFTSKTDVWSFGVLLWEILSLGYMPYPGMTNQEVMQYVAQGERMHPPRNCPMPVYRIMTQCWQDIPENRPPFKTIKERVGYCLQDPDVLETALPLSAVSDSDLKRKTTIIRPANLKTMPAIDTQQFRPLTDIHTAPSSLNCSRESLLAPTNESLGSGSYVALAANQSTPESDSANQEQGSSCSKSLESESEPKDGAEGRTIDDSTSPRIEKDAGSVAESEVSINELTDLIKTRTDPPMPDSKLPTVGQSELNMTPLLGQNRSETGHTTETLHDDKEESPISASESSLNSLSSGSSPKRKLFCVKRDSGVQMVFDDDVETGCPV